MNKKIGIITVLYNSEKVLPDFFESINKQTYDSCVLYIIDNNSKDKSLDVTERFKSTCKFNVVVISNKENFGIAVANNQGIVRALADNCDYVLLTNNDVLFDESVIENLEAGISNSSCSLSVPKIYFYDTKKLWAAGGYFNYISFSTPHYGYNKQDCCRYSKSRIVKYSATCFMLIKREVFLRTGIMDEDYFVYYDDADFVYRCKKNKFKLFYNADCCIYHKESSCVGNKSDFFYKNVFKNRLIFIRKNFKFAKLIIFFQFLYHFTVRNLKLRKNRYLWCLIMDAMFDGARA